MTEPGNWENKCVSQIPDIEVSAISGLAGTDGGKFFIYTNEANKGGALHIGAEGHDWQSLSIPSGFAGHYFIDEVAPDGSSLILIPHKAGKPPILISISEENGRYSSTIRALPRARSYHGFLAPCLFTYSPDSQYLALTTRNGGDKIDGLNNLLMGMLDLHKVLEICPPSTAIDMRDKDILYSPTAMASFSNPVVGTLTQDPSVAQNVYTSRNASHFAFINGGTAIVKAMFHQPENKLKLRMIPLMGTEFEALEKQAVEIVEGATIAADTITATQLRH
jgi:hypothetical protein